MKYLIISQCTGKKLNEPARAADLYTGLQQQRINKGIEESPHDVDLYLVSAGRGLVHADTVIEPYDVTFKGKRAGEIREMADALNIPQDTHALLASTDADRVIVALGGDYLRAIALTKDTKFAAPTTFLTNSTMANRIRKLEIDNVSTLPLGVKDTREFSCGFVGLKGQVVRRMIKGEHDG